MSNRTWIVVLVGVLGLIVVIAPAAMRGELGANQAALAASLIHAAGAVAAAIVGRVVPEMPPASPGRRRRGRLHRRGRVASSAFDEGV